MLRLGILGLGEGRSTMSAALKSEKWELKTICDRNEALCQQRCKEFDFHNYTLDFQEMLDYPQIDAIGIYTPDHLHATHIKMALTAGKHVVCTKPLLDNLADAAELLKISEETGKKVFVGQSSRFFEPMKRQRQDYVAGEIGELVTIEANYNADHRWFLGKGWSLQDSFKWLYGGLSHPVDLVRWYLPNIEEVMGYGMLSPNGKAGGLKNEDTMHFILKATDGRIASVSGTYTCPIQPQQRDSEMTCILRGSEGCSQGDYMDLRYAITDKTGEEKLITFDHKLKHYFRFEGKSHHAGEYQNYLEYFADCLEKGVTAYPDLKEGIGTIAVMKAMEESLKTGVPVKVKSLLEDIPL
ncbi:Gfo/Idh/MocA family protein [Mangrovibacterium lignilyticum]|uniref:Gfo/Idh/MocA family protein n=1 Tax=Mangrovibacterium lignilyticum TaxID=2668052 RepID=UPI0013D37F37|nr:Gfo/Idh/MocA family oxidoreductase [Mangrovibacterium lignilyticum]